MGYLAADVRLAGRLELVGRQAAPEPAQRHRNPARHAGSQLEKLGSGQICDQPHWRRTVFLAFFQTHLLASLSPV